MRLRELAIIHEAEHTDEEVLVAKLRAIRARKGTNPPEGKGPASAKTSSECPKHAESSPHGKEPASSSSSSQSQKRPNACENDISTGTSNSALLS